MARVRREKARHSQADRIRAPKPGTRCSRAEWLAAIETAHKQKQMSDHQYLYLIAVSHFMDESGKAEVDDAAVAVVYEQLLRQWRAGGGPL